MTAEGVRRTSGWVIFAGVIIAISAVSNIIYGLTMLINDEWVVLAPRAIVTFDLTTAGWITLGLGVLQFVVALGVFNGDLWARVLGIIGASLVIISQFAFMSVYPGWAWFGIIVNGLIIYGLAVHGDEVAKF